METVKSIAALSRALAKFPGIGAKTALRLAYFVITLPAADVEEMAAALVTAKRAVHPCPLCGNYTDQDACAICVNPRRTNSTLCVVRDPRDVQAMERTHDFHGRYHVLMGVISPMEGIGPDQIRIKELLERVRQHSTQEVILATNPDVEGEATATYIAAQLRPLGVRVTRIAHGVPIGSNLEYVDEITLTRAMQGRTEL